MMKGRNNKRAILLFTDGVDNASELTAPQMAEILQRVSVPVYAIGMKNAAFDVVKERQRRELSVENLQMLAGSSGGKMHLVGGERGPPAPGGADLRARSGSSICWGLRRQVRGM